MAKQLVNINDNSISRAVTSDYKKAICEYIWNGFDAKATTVELKYEADELGNITSMSVTDDGEGINRESLHETFGCYQDSIKKRSFQWSSQVKGNQGRGRYAFNCFADKAEWDTVFDRVGALLRHKLYIDKGDNHHFDDGEEKDLKVVHGRHTGTIVSFSNVNIPVEALENEDFMEYLCKEFAVFLELNKAFGKQLLINGQRLNYAHVIAESEQQPFSIEIDGETQTFEATFIRWNNKMKENYSAYFLDEEKIEKYEKTTSFNRKDTEFHHSVYVESAYFNDFEFDKDDTDLFGSHKTPKDKFFVKLCAKIKEYLREKEKLFVRNVGAANLIVRFEEKGIIPKNPQGIDRFIQKELKDTITEIYCVEPRVFINIKEEQAKILVGLLSVILKTGNQSDLFTILESVINLNDEERHELAGVLQHAELNYITKVIKELEDRCTKVSALKAAIYNPDYGADEVHDLQEMVPNMFWLFGEEYNIVTEAEPDFEEALTRYIDEVHKTTKGKSKSRRNKQKIDHPDKNKEMDIFAFRQSFEHNQIENIVVELKHPNVKLGEVELSQVKTYMNVITEQPMFNAPNMTWKFYLVGNEFDSSNFIVNEIKNSTHHGKQNLVQHITTDNGVLYEIYVKPWSMIFNEFELRYKYLFDKLHLKRDGLKAAGSKNKDELKEIVNR